MVKEGGGDREIRGRKRRKKANGSYMRKKKKKSMVFSIGKKAESGRQISEAEYAP